MPTFIRGIYLAEFQVVFSAWDFTHVHRLSKSLGSALPTSALALPESPKNETKCLLEKAPMATSALLVLVSSHVSTAI